MAASIIPLRRRDVIEDLLPKDGSKALSHKQIAEEMGLLPNKHNLQKIRLACTSLKRFGAADCREVRRPKKQPMLVWAPGPNYKKFIDRFEAMV